MPGVTARFVLLVMAAACVGALSSVADAQSHPAGARRVWAEVGIGGGQQSARCPGCTRATPLGGAMVTGAIGLTLPHGFGAALEARAFHVLSFEMSRSSRYVAALGQFTPQKFAPLTVNVGAGWARHRDADVPTNGDAGAVLAAGVALRLPPHSQFGLAITTDVMQSIGGATTTRPRLLSVGLALSLASARSDAGPAR